MKCKHCADKLRATFVHRMTPHGLTSLPGYECPKCLAIYDTNGNQLEKPLRNTKEADK